MQILIGRLLFYDVTELMIIQSSYQFIFLYGKSLRFVTRIITVGRWYKLLCQSRAPVEIQHRAPFLFVQFSLMLPNLGLILCISNTFLCNN